MWNSLKMDLYRLFHQRSFYITLVILIGMYLWLLNGDGIQSNSVYASFDRETATIVDFLYYFPKNVFYQVGVLIMITIFVADEYGNGFIKNIYPFTYVKEHTLMERLVFSFLLSMILSFGIILMAVCSSALPNHVFGELSLLDYGMYLCTQSLILCAYASLLMMLIHLTRSKLLSVLLSCSYGFMLNYLVSMGIANLLFHNTEMIENSLYMVSGRLPYTWSLSGYQTALLSATVVLLVCNGCSHFILKKKDLL